jgi:hypothetical protein
MIKIIGGKVGGPECTRLTKLATQFWLAKDPFGENIFIWSKEILIWMSKDLMRIFERLNWLYWGLNCKENQFFESIWVSIEKTMKLGDWNWTLKSLIGH